MKKERVFPTTNVKDYGIRFNLKRETEVPLGSSEIQTLLRNLKSSEKNFRYKKRYSFTTKDNLFSFDMTVVKSSESREVRAPSQKKAKRDIKPFLRKYVIAPEYENNPDAWFDNLADDDVVELVGKKYMELVPKKDIKAVSYTHLTLPTILRV